MRQSRLFGRTVREVPAGAETASHQLLLRAGYIDALASGVYTMLPLGLRVQRKVEQTVRRVMDSYGGQEIQMPILQPVELWRRSGRDAAMRDVLFTLQDRRGQRHVLGPTHEEVVTQLAAGHLRGHRDLPLLLYQMHTKHRDEARPRGGLLRVREFTMKDAYSFDRDQAGLDAAYRAMVDAYGAIFQQCGLDVIPAQADSGAIGGGESVEFILAAECGEDTLIRCPACGAAANAERAAFRRDLPAGVMADPEPQPVEEVHTPGIKTIDALATFLGVHAAQTMKAMFYHATRDGQSELIVVAIRGDLAVNEVKLSNYLKVDTLRLANDAEVAAAGLVAGSASPVGLQHVHTVVDLSIPDAVNLVAGANRPDTHLVNVNYGRDFTASAVLDIGLAAAGLPCVSCGTPLVAARGIKLGHVFKLGTRYSETFDAQFLDQDGVRRPAWMGCYGIGIGRTLAAVVEMHHDERGIVWPATLAPYHVHLVALNVDNADVAAAAGGLYDALVESGVEVLFDDRVESAGVKFNDADLIGLPLRVTIGPLGIRQGIAEVRPRAGGDAVPVPLESLAGHLREQVAVLLENEPASH